MAAENVQHEVDLQSVDIEGGEKAPFHVDQDYSGEGIRLILNYRENTYNAARFHFSTPINATVTGILTFEARISPTYLNNFGFSVLLVDEAGKTYTVNFWRHVEQLEEGVYRFRWDVVNQPGNDQGTDLENVTRLHLKFNFPSLDPDNPLQLEISNMRFIEGEAVATGDPERFKAWRETMAGYKPDYSEGQSFSEPPAEGRLAKPFPLVVDGVSKGCIVLPGTASPVEENAARELQQWIQKITSTEVPIVHTEPEPDVAAIILGKTLAPSTFAGDLDFLAGTDGFAIRPGGNNRLHIFGAQDKGTMNGVFAFLENNTDLIWARPQPDYGTVFSTSPDFQVRWGDAVDRPATEYRGWLPNLGGGEDFWLWSDRNRNNYVGGNPPRQYEWGNRVEFGGGHNLQSFIPKDDPKYFPVVDGARPETLSIWKHQICLSVPGLVDTFAANVVSYIQEKAPPGLDVFNIKIEDNWGVCECEACTAPIVLPDGKKIASDHPAFRSTQFYIFLNQVTAKLNETFPDLNTQTYAYFYTAVPPLVEVNPNVFVLFCPYVRPDHKTPLYSPINSTWWQRLTDWAAMSRSVLIREYYGILNEGRPLAEVVAADVAADLDLGVRNFTAEITPDFFRVWSNNILRGAEDEFDLSAMEYWLINKIYWNPSADLEQLRRYYLHRTFREAAPMMERFFGTIRQGWFENLRPPSDWGNLRRMWQTTVASKGLESEMMGYLDEAMQVATHPASRVMIQKIRNRFTTGLQEGDADAPKAEGLTLSDRLLHGWGTRIEGNKSYSTHIERNGQLLPALRLVVADFPPHSHDPTFNCSFPGDIRGKTFRFVILPADNSELSGTLPMLSITDDKWQVETAGPEAFSPSEEYPGGMEFVWTPSGIGQKGEPVNLEQITRLQFFIDQSEVDESALPLQWILLDFSARAENS